MPSKDAVLGGGGVVTTPAFREEVGGVDSAPARTGRRPYRAPRLACHGTVVDLTRFGGSQVLDSGGGLGQQL
jgi:hypothetical protein